MPHAQDTPARDSWPALVVDAMLEFKRAGFEFEEAWSMALARWPARGRDTGPRSPALFDGMTTWQIRHADTLVGFFKRACDDAWHGRKPALQHFHPSLLMEPDDSSPAAMRRSGARQRMAA